MPRTDALTVRDAVLVLGELARGAGTAVDGLADDDLDGAVGRLRALATNGPAQESDG